MTNVKTDFVAAMKKVEADIVLAAVEKDFIARLMGNEEGFALRKSLMSINFLEMVVVPFQRHAIRMPIVGIHFAYPW